MLCRLNLIIRQVYSIKLTFDLHSTVCEINCMYEFRWVVNYWHVQWCKWTLAIDQCSWCKWRMHRYHATVGSWATESRRMNEIQTSRWPHGVGWRRVKETMRGGEPGMRSRLATIHTRVLLHEFKVAAAYSLISPLLPFCYDYTLKRGALSFLYEWDGWLGIVIT